MQLEDPALAVLLERLDVIGSTPSSRKPASLSFNYCVVGGILCKRDFSGLGYGRSWLLLQLNALINKVLCAAIPVFNVYFMLLSEDPNDAILNSLALIFVIQLDEMVLPEWDGERVSDRIACSTHDYIMEPQAAGDLAAAKIGAGEYTHTDKLYVVLVDSSHISMHSDTSGISVDDVELTQFSVVVYKQEGDTAYSKTTSAISGAKASEFYEAISQFECLTNFEDCHD